MSPLEAQLASRAKDKIRQTTGSRDDNGILGTGMVALTARVDAGGGWRVGERDAPG